MGALNDLRTEPLSIAEQLALWHKLCSDPLYGNLPGKTETDAYGRLLMSPLNFNHSRMQGRIAYLLQTALGGEAMPEAAIATPGGVKEPDVVWCSDAFLRAHAGKETLTRAPEICVEVLSSSNTQAEMREKIALYLAAGAQEVWLVSQAGEVEIHGADGVRSQSTFGVDVAGLRP
jgi:Uma2 family endonuclease